MYYIVKIESGDMNGNGERIQTMEDGLEAAEIWAVIQVKHGRAEIVDDGYCSWKAAQQDWTWEGRRPETFDKDVEPTEHMVEELSEEEREAQADRLSNYE